MSNPCGGGPPPPGRPAAVNTQPNSVEPGPGVLSAAMRTLPGVLNGLPHAGPGGFAPTAREVHYPALRRGLTGLGHAADAAEWAIHRHAEAGRLVPVPGCQGNPNLYRPGVGLLVPTAGSAARTSDKERCRLRATPELFAWTRTPGATGTFDAAPETAAPADAARAAAAVPPAVRNWLVARFLRDPTPLVMGPPLDGPVAFERMEVFADFLVERGFDVLPTLEACRTAGWVADLMFDLFPEESGVGTPTPAGVLRLGLPPGRHRVVGIRPAVLADPAAGEPRPGPTPRPARNSLTARAESGDVCLKMKAAVYARIKSETGKPADILDRLKADKQFAVMVRAANLKLDPKLVRAARRKPDKR